MNEVTSSPAFSVVVPLYNEEANLPILQERIARRAERTRL